MNGRCVLLLFAMTCGTTLAQNLPCGITNPLDVRLNPLPPGCTDSEFHDGAGTYFYPVPVQSTCIPLQSALPLPTGYDLPQLLCSTTVSTPLGDSGGAIDSYPVPSPAFAPDRRPATVIQLDQGFDVLDCGPYSSTRYLGGQSVNTGSSDVNGNGIPDGFDFLIIKLDDYYAKGYRRVVLSRPTGTKVPPTNRTDCVQYESWWSMPEWKRVGYMSVRAWVDAHPEITLEMHWVPPAITTNASATDALGWNNPVSVARVLNEVRPWIMAGFSRIWMDESSDGYVGIQQLNSHPDLDVLLVNGSRARFGAENFRRVNAGIICADRNSGPLELSGRYVDATAIPYITSAQFAGWTNRRHDLLGQFNTLFACGDLTITNPKERVHVPDSPSSPQHYSVAQSPGVYASALLQPYTAVFDPAVTESNCWLRPNLSSNALPWTTAVDLITNLRLRGHIPWVPDSATIYEPAVFRQFEFGTVRIADFHPVGAGDNILDATDVNQFSAAYAAGAGLAIPTIDDGDIYPPASQVNGLWTPIGDDVLDSNDLLEFVAQYNLGQPVFIGPSHP